MTEQVEGVQEEVVEESGHPQELLDEASRMGWVPLEKWTREPGDWVDADQYVKRGHEINGFLNKSLKKERQRADTLEAEILRMKEQIKGFSDYREKLEKTIYEQAMKDLKAQMRSARAEGDTDAENRLEDQMEALRKEEPKPAASPSSKAQGEHPAFTSWKPDNTWYGTNDEMTAYADSIFISEMRKSQKTGVKLDPEEALATVTAGVHRHFPDEFPNSGTRPAMFESSRSGPNSSVRSSKGFPSLPPDAKGVFERYWKDGYYPGMKREEAQSEYFRVYNEG